MEWTITNGKCVAKKDSVRITIAETITNTIDTTTLTSCAGAEMTLTGVVAATSSGSYTYQWQKSNNGTAWVNIAGADSEDYTYTTATTQWFRRLALFGLCSDTSLIKHVIVVPAIGNNVIAGAQTICINNPGATITGQVPSGANGYYNYSWESSTDSATWNTINAAIQKEYVPGTLAQTTWFRRIVSSAFCSGDQANMSNTIKIGILPNAKANFSVATMQSCVPFVITNANIQATAFPQLNSNYNWYANNSFIGSGLSFPGFTINKSNDSVVIKLEAISLAGCASDFVEVKFNSLSAPALSFNLPDTTACGATSVNITNTTSSVNNFSYFWDFGNGQTSTLAQPGVVHFKTDSLNRDTVYTVKLYSYNCDTLVVTKSIKVKSAPKALFTPDKTTGCSPFKVSFNNKSRGSNNIYKWTFGDGQSLTTTSANAVQHTYYTAKLDTFNVILIASNECGSDTMVYKLVTSPNTIHVDFAVNGNEAMGCAPHLVRFINNSTGGNVFKWNMGDGNILTTLKNIDTITHLYNTPGNYAVTLNASNVCSDTSDTEMVRVFKTPVAAFSTSASNVCIGDSVKFINSTDSATSYNWSFGDGKISSLTNPVHLYTSASNYLVKLIAKSTYAGSNTCSDTLTAVVKTVLSQQGLFTVSDSSASCLPFTVTFTNQSKPSILTAWDFGNGIKDTGEVVTHTFTKQGSFVVTMKAQHPGGCSYQYSRAIKTFAPTGILKYDKGLICGIKPIRFDVNSTNTDSVKVYFGDGTYTTTTNTFVYHTYYKPGTYLPDAELFSGNCKIKLTGVDTIKVDIIDVGFTTADQKQCAVTTVSFNDTTRSGFNICKWNWNFGDGKTSAVQKPFHNFTSTNNWPVSLIATSTSGCKDTTSVNVFVKVNNKPVIRIIADTVACAGSNIVYTIASASSDSLSFYNWNFSAGTRANTSAVSVNYSIAGKYNVMLVAATQFGCFDTAYHYINVNPSPFVKTIEDRVVCKGQSIPVITSGGISYSWSPVNALNCSTCASPVASPLNSTAYVVTGKNSFGCTAKDTVTLTVAQPVKLAVSQNDSLCIGQSASLSASGAHTYQWSPSAALTQVTASVVKVAPVATTKYRVVGSDELGCFKDTAYITVAVGEYPVVNLGQDKVLASGDKLQMNPKVTNGPISKWSWFPAGDLSCTNCPAPVAQVKNDVCYSVLATNAFGCAGTDTVCIRTFCEGSQVFIPNAFTPDGDGVNDHLFVRGKGIKLIKSFRVFNRWGQVVFERANFTPDNNTANAWDGRIKGKDASPDAYIYTCEVVCDNETPFTYKGNVTLLK